MPNKRVNVWLDEDIIKEVKKIAIDKETSLSQIIMDLLIKYVKEQKNGGV